MEEEKYQIIIDQNKKILKISRQFLDNIDMTEKEFLDSIYIDALFEKFLPAPNPLKKEEDIKPFKLPIMLKNYNLLLNKNIHPFYYFSVHGKILTDLKSKKSYYQLILKDVTPEVELNYIQNTDYLLTTLSVSNLKLQDAMKTIEMHKIMLMFLTTSLIEEYNKETSDHLQKIQEITANIANEYIKEKAAAVNDYDKEQYVKDLTFTSVFHDIGKMGIPNEILEKNRSLTDDEKNIIKDHTLIGASYIQKIIDFLKGKQDFASYLKFLQIPYEICLYHHEQWDGNGYPRNLKGKNIPLPARIVAVADSYDAIRSRRSYHNAKSHEDTVNIIKDESGTRFDPEVVSAFLKISPTLEKIKYQ
jgi:HD-GYP domain-containing protein (c-di-GMP phosphodiesterase class II)